MGVIPKEVKVKGGELPEEPGVYLMKDARGGVLYVGKAANLRRRVESYFTRPHDTRLEEMVSRIQRVDYERAGTAIEALIREAALIKTLAPPFNIREKDDKSFLYVVITKERVPRILVIRGKGLERWPRKRVFYYGPFTSSSSLREALHLIRRIFPFNVHSAEEIARAKRPCFERQIGLCPGACASDFVPKAYLENLRHIKTILGGRMKKLVSNLKKDMLASAKALEFERAMKYRLQIFALEHIQDVALMEDSQFSFSTDSQGGKQRSSQRLEGYDVSNISGTAAVGVMAVFESGAPKKSDYRKFRIKTVEGPNDVGMLKEVLRRRLNHDEWPLPICFLIDGGKGQVGAAKEVLGEYGYEIPVVGIAKGPKRKRNDFVGTIPKNIEPITLIRLRDEAHRFAVGYHKKVRRVQSFG